MSIITQLWRTQPGKYFFLATKSASGKFREHVFKKGEWREVDKFIAENGDKDVYFCPHGFTRPARRKECAAPTTLLWADLDEVKPRDVRLRPTMCIESSPGHANVIWCVDRETSEALNRRLTYLIGADRSGWDLTQVLRVPGTTNYKYEGKPAVRLLWSNGPTYKLRDIERAVKGVKGEDDEDEGDGAADIFKKYEKKLPAWVRRELINGKPRQGSRSDMIWKLEHTLLECGLSTEEAFSLIKASAWNKFKGRDAQLRKELDKAVKAHLRGAAYKTPGKWLQTTLEDIELKSLDWVWYPYLARGELTILEGDPGVGKSYLAQIIAAALCDGKKLPSTRPRHIKGKVAYFDVENSGGTVTKARVLDNGVKNMGSFYKEDRLFVVDSDADAADVLDAIEELKPVLVVFDTIGHYLGRADAHKSTEALQSFSFFRDLAVRFNCAVLVLRHLTKSGGVRALYRGQGSISFAGLARIVLTVGLDPEDKETKVLAMTKNNFTKPAASMSFYVEELPPTLKRDDRSRFVWGELREDLSADDLVGTEPKTGGEKPIDLARAFLEEALSEEAIEFSKLMRMAEARSISRQVLYRAADRLGVVKKQAGFGKEKDSIWALK